ncbi:MAG: type II secretion system minor pseudopilin GspJ [Gammaproteobacteria bacterium]
MRARFPVVVACRGFTLLELLVALAIFGLLAAMSYGGLQAVMTQQSQTEIAADRLSELQKLFLIMQRDIEQVVLRPIRNEYGDVQPPLIGAETLQLTRAGWRNPAGRQRSQLQRVGYALEEDRLVRYTWAVLDRAQDSEPLVQLLSEAVEQLQIRYLGADNEWKEQWPDTQASADPAIVPVLLPRVVEVTVQHETYGPLVWLFQLPR